jgi:hypothetical protein
MASNPMSPGRMRGWVDFIAGIPVASRFKTSLRVGSGATALAALDGSDGIVMADGTLAGLYGRDRANSARYFAIYDSARILRIYDSVSATDVFQLDLSTGAITQSAWVAMTGSYTNSWVDFGGGYMAGAYMKDLMGFVHLRGLIKSGTMSTSAFTLPAGFRPSAVVLMACASAGAYGQLEVGTGGTITPTVGLNNYVSLNGVTFDTR